MKCNIGKLDRALRIVAGLGIIGAGLYFQNWLGLIGLVPLMTAVVRFCPAYTVLGITTDKA